MEIINQIVAKQKAIEVIESCEIDEHYDMAQKYIELYHKMYGDFIGYNELYRLINNGQNPT
jgi:hypothetical protein